MKGNSMKRVAYLIRVAMFLASVIMAGWGCGPQGAQISAYRPLPPHLAPRPMPTGPDANFARAKEGLAQLQVDTAAVQVWDAPREAEFAELLSQVRTLGTHTAEAERLRADFDRLMATYRSRRLKQELTRRLPETYADSVGIQMKLIMPGTFTMGSPPTESGHHSDEGPPRAVTITRPFYMSVHEVTQAQWRSVMDTEPWRGETSSRESPDLAASWVSWDDAMVFCRKLSAMTGTAVRLPTEAEWEYACRAGTTTAYSFGDDASKLGDYAWYSENAFDKDEKYPHPVGRKQPNAWGLYDMHGNVWEWCADWYADSYANADARDPKGSASGSARVLRGGSWFTSPQYCRAAYRRWITPDYRYDGIGFRVVVLPGVGVD